LVTHYARLYGARTKDVVGPAATLAGLGRHFGGQLYEAEARYLVAREWAQTAEDVLWRRTKHRLHLTPAEQKAFADWFAADLAKAA
jgi:glycerol-3-phosphate dehydrogenase